MHLLVKAVNKSAKWASNTSIQSMRIRILTLLVAASLGQTFATDWPQWGGPRRDHVSDEQGLLQEWPAGGPKRVWLNDTVGIGYSGFAVLGASSTRWVRGTRPNESLPLM